MFSKLNFLTYIFFYSYSNKQTPGMARRHKFTSEQQMFWQFDISNYSTIWASSTLMQQKYEFKFANHNIHASVCGWFMWCSCLCRHGILSKLCVQIQIMGKFHIEFGYEQMALGAEKSASCIPENYSIISLQTSALFLSHSILHEAL